jgi:predicted nucleotidyltransferase component of viral defense system
MTSQGKSSILHNPEQVMPKNTAKLFEILTKIMPEELKSQFILVGGTALSLHIAHRTSEDLDFFSIKERISPQTSDLIQKMLKDIREEFNMKSSVRGAEINQVDYWVDGVKMTFCARGLSFVDDNCSVMGGIKIASIDTLIAMKAKAIQAQRTKSRDFFDIAALIESGHTTFRNTWEKMVEKYPDAPFTESMLANRLLERSIDDDDEGFASLVTFNGIAHNFSELRKIMANYVFEITIEDEHKLENVLQAKIISETDKAWRCGLSGNTIAHELYKRGEDVLLARLIEEEKIDPKIENYAGENVSDLLRREKDLFQEPEDLLEPQNYLKV